MAPENLARISARLLVFSLSLAGCVACPLLLHAGNPQVTTSALLAHPLRQVLLHAGNPQVTTSESTPAAPTATTSPEINMTQLTGQPWRITAAPSHAPTGSIYVFLQNGTLLETSCAETYRIATWTSDKRAPQVLHVVEDHRPAFTATILQLTPSTLRMQQRFARTHERREITLTAVTDEFACPDLPR